MRGTTEVVTKETYKSWKDYAWFRLFLVFSTLTTATILTLAIGGDWERFAKLWITISLNIFAIPLLLWAWSFVWWVNYIIIIEWLGVIGYCSLTKRLLIRKVSE